MCDSVRLLFFFFFFLLPINSMGTSRALTNCRPARHGRGLLARPAAERRCLLLGVGGVISACTSSYPGPCVAQLGRAEDGRRRAAWRDRSVTNLPTWPRRLWFISMKSFNTLRMGQQQRKRGKRIAVGDAGLGSCLCV